MLKHVYLIFISTFVFGLIAGSLLFMQSHMGQEGGGDIKEDAAGYAITVYGYGGCERIGCPLYHVTQDGSYVFIDAEGTRHEGTLPFDSRRDIGNALLSTRFEEVAASTFEGQCPIIYDGMAYRYDITYTEQEYHFDSCAQSLDGVPLFSELNEYFTLFTERHAE
jgi:hypothetical protein